MFHVKVNPARAGMILVPVRALGRPERKPRASGDDPAIRLADDDAPW